MWLSTPSKTLIILLITIVLSACDKGKKPYEEAEALFNKSDYAAAKSKAAEVVKNAPKSKYLAQAKALYERIEKIEIGLKTAEEAVQSSEYKEAIKGYEDALALDNKNQKTIKVLQEVKEVYRNGLMEDARFLYVDNGDYEKGIANYKEVLAYIPGDKTATAALQNAEATFARLRQMRDNAMEEFRIYIQARGSRNLEAAEVARIRYLRGAEVICRIHGGRASLAAKLMEYQTEVETALNDFISKGKAVQRLGSSDQRVLAADDYNRALANFVANYGRPEAWLERDARKAVKDKNVNNWIPEDAASKNLFNAVFSGNSNRVKMLLANGTDVNSKNEMGDTPLLLAAYKDHVEIARLLVEKGALVNAKNIYGKTALILAAETGYTDVAKLFIEKGADINIKDKEGFTALMWAANNDHIEIAKLLIDKGANLNMHENIVGGTALMLAAGLGHFETVKALLLAGADVNLKTRDNVTALRAAALNGHSKISEILIEKGADINAKDSSGKTPLGRAIEEGHKEVADVLRKHGAKE